jgi:hypothetical protein
MLRQCAQAVRVQAPRGHDRGPAVAAGAAARALWNITLTLAPSSLHAGQKSEYLTSSFSSASSRDRSHFCAGDDMGERGRGGSRENTATAREPACARVRSGGRRQWREGARKQTSTMNKAKVQ